jgi:cardiolipin synthase (CMP-forming)
MLKKIPNILTIGRIIIVPFFVIAFYLPGFYGDIIALVLFIIASFTDFLDGMLARMMEQESKLGELLDPIADKIIVAAALILLVMNGAIKNFEVIAAIIILTREILISGLREFLAKGRIKLPVSNLAKLKTVLQMVSIGLLLSGETGNKIINFQDYNAQTIGIILLWLSAFLTLYTGYEYVRKGIDHAISEDNKN